MQRSKAFSERTRLSNDSISLREISLDHILEKSSDIIVSTPDEVVRSNVRADELSRYADTISRDVRNSLDSAPSLLSSEHSHRFLAFRLEQGKHFAFLQHRQKITSLTLSLIIWFPYK